MSAFEEIPPWLQRPTTNGLTDQSTTWNPAEQIENTTTEEVWAKMLPAAYQDQNYMLHEPEGDIDWLCKQFDLKRLENIGSYLRLAGRPMPPRPLLYQKATGREICVTHQMDMHLLLNSKHLYLRPAPNYIFSTLFWDKIRDDCDTHCEKDAQLCRHQNLYLTAMGFLYSYIALLPEYIDFRIAHEAGLLPFEMSWFDWKAFVSRFLRENKNQRHVHQRFFYGTLRLGRLNKIYRFVLGDHRGYRYEYQEYGDFICRYLGLIAIFTGYVVVALTAMQVGLANDFLHEQAFFQRVTYQFTMFSILAPLGLVLVVFMAFLFLVVNNLYRTREFHKKREQYWKNTSEAS